jgi:hypothetical protein
MISLQWLASSISKYQRKLSHSLDECKALNDMRRKLFSRVVKDLAEGTYRRDDQGLLFYRDTPIPKGVRL